MGRHSRKGRVSLEGYKIEAHGGRDCFRAQGSWPIVCSPKIRPRPQRTNFCQSPDRAAQPKTNHLAPTGRNLATAGSL
jgi:hypothetical protein